jgi:arylsulfatase A-like enzyme
VFGRVARIPKVTRWDYTKSGDAVGSPAFERYRDARIRLYDAAVRSADASLQDLWSALDSHGVAGDTISVVTADHGEEFWEHRAEELEGFTDPRDVYGVGHGHNLFQVHLLIPLLFSGPGIAAGAVEDHTSLVDVLPTVFAAAGLETPPVDGKPLVEAVNPRPILAEAIAYGYEKKAVVVGDLKLLSGPGDGYERLFRLGPDRRESEIVDDPGQAAALRRHLPGEAEAMGEQVEATAEIVDHLRDLGYIE